MAVIIPDQPRPKPGSKFNRFAKFKRRAPGERNKVEAAYEAHLTLLKVSGEIMDFHFEGMKLRLADLSFITPDFLVFAADGTVELHDTKGTKMKKRAHGEKEPTPFIEEDAKLKMKVLAERFPFRVFTVFYHKGQWLKEEY